MATDWVVDASIAVKLLASEPDSEHYRAFVADFPVGGRLLAPALLRYEVGHALTKRGPVENLENQLAKGLALIEQLEPVDVAGRQGGLSYYDAAYLALAIEQKAGLLTADAKLRQAAERHGVEVGP